MNANLLYKASHMGLFNMCANGQLDVSFSAASDSLRETPESPVKGFMFLVDVYFTKVCQVQAFALVL